MTIAIHRRSAILAAAGSLALFASLAAPAFAAGDPASLAAKYPSGYVPYAAPPAPADALAQPERSGPAAHGDPRIGTEPYANPGANVNLGQGSGMGRMIGR